MMGMARAGGPRGIDKRVVQVLLDLLHDLVGDARGLVVLQHIGGKAHDFGVVRVANGGGDIASKETDGGNDDGAPRSLLKAMPRLPSAKTSAASAAAA